MGIPVDKKSGACQIEWTASFFFTVCSVYRCHQGLGVVLSQVQDGREHVIAYASRSLHSAERNYANYSSFKLELLALKWAVTEKFKDYLTGAKFTVVTDNNRVAHLQTAKLGAVEQRWVAQLASYDFVVKYWAGQENGNADSLS